MELPAAPDYARNRLFRNRFAYSAGTFKGWLRATQRVALFFFNDSEARLQSGQTSYVRLTIALKAVVLYKSLREGTTWGCRISVIRFV